MKAKQPVKSQGKNAIAVDILDAVDDAYFSLDGTSRVTFANKKMGGLLGRDAGELVGKNVLDMISEPVGWTFHRHLEKAMSEGTFIKLDFFKLAGRRFEVYFYPLQSGLAVFLHDITTKWHTDELFRLALFLLDRLNESVFLVRSDGRLFHTNDQTSRLLGYARDELIHMKIHDLDASITADGWEKEFHSIKERGRVIFESTLKAKDGTLIPVEECANYIELYGYEYYCAAARDITERKNAEQALRKSEAELARGQKISHIGSWTWDLITDELTWSDQSYHNYGLIPGEVKPTYELFLSFIVPEDRERVDMAVQKAIDTGEKYNVSYNIIRKDGEPRVLLSENEVIRDGSGKVVGMYGTNQDITERTKEQKILEKYLLFSENAHDIIIFVRRDGLILEANEAALKAYGYSYEELLSITIYDLRASDSKHLIEDQMEKSFKDGLLFETIHRRKDGSTFPVEVSSQGKIIGGQKVLLSVVRDITERKQNELELQNAKTQVEMYNDLLGHDINNMNQVGIGYLELAIESLELSEEDKKLLSKPLEALINSSMLIENVRKLQHIKSGGVRHKLMDVNQVLLDVKKSYSNVKDRNIVINYSPMPGCLVNANDLLRDVFSNLVGNAIKHSTGMLEIGVGVCHVSEDGRKYCRAYVEDNGPGISDSVKNTLFTRFKRGDTHASGKGLGLYLVKTLVEDYGGRVWVEDRVPGDHSKGCRFVVLLPAMEE